MEASEQKPTVPAPAQAPAPAPAKAAPAQQAPEKEERYGLAGWRERAMRLGVSPHALAGALHDLAADARLSEEEVRQRLEEFHRRPGVASEEAE